MCATDPYLLLPTHSPCTSAGVKRAHAGKKLVAVALLMTPICVSGQAKPKPLESVSGGSARRPASAICSCVATIIGAVTEGWQTAVEAGRAGSGRELEETGQ